MLVPRAGLAQDESLPDSPTQTSTAQDEEDGPRVDAARPSLSVVVVDPDDAPAGPGYIKLKITSTTSGGRDEVSFNLDAKGIGLANIDTEVLGLALISVSEYVRFDAEGHIPTQTAIPDSGLLTVTLTAGVNAPLRLKLLRPPAVEFEVVDAGGRPVEGAEVYTLGAGCSGFYKVAQITNEKGLARFAPWRFGSDSFSAVDPRTLARGEVAVDVRPNRENRYTIRLLPPPAPGFVEVTCIDDTGAPVAVTGEINAYAPGTDTDGLGFLGAQAQTLEEPGRTVTIDTPTAVFRLEPLAAGARELHARGLKARDLTPPARGVPVVVPVGGTVQAKLRFRRLGSVEVRAAIGDKPCEVWVLSHDEEGREGRAYSPSGNAVVACVGRMDLEINTRDFPASRRSVNVAPGTTERLNVSFRRDCTIKATVHIRYGIDVVAWPVGTPQRFVKGNYWSGESKPVVLLVEEPGTYEVAAGRLVRRVEVVPGTPAEVEFDFSGEPAEEASQEYGDVIARVLDGDSRAAEASIVVRATGRESFIEFAQNGVYTMQLPAGKHTLSALRGEVEGPRVQVELTGGQVLNVSLSLGPSPAIVQGMLTGIEPGARMPAVVRARRADGSNEALGSYARRLEATAAPDTNGRFKLGPLTPEETYRIEVADPNFVSTPVEVKLHTSEERSVEVAVTPLRRGRLTVSGKGLADVRLSGNGFARVELEQSGGVFSVAAPGGRYRLLGRFAGDPVDERRLDREVVIDAEKPLTLEVARTSGAASFQALVVFREHGWAMADELRDVELRGPGMSVRVRSNRPVRLGGVPAGPWQFVRDDGRTIDLDVPAGDKDLGVVEPPG